MTASNATLVPTRLAHDADGRLVYFSVDSTQPLPSQNDNPWLIAVDRSDNALRAVRHALQQSGAIRTNTLHLIHVEPWLAKEAAEAELVRRATDATAAARDLLDAAGHPWRLHVAMGEPAERIIAQANELNCRCIVLGSRGLNVAQSVLFGSVAYKVLHLSPVPVLVVP